MPPLGQERRIWAFLGTSAVPLNADIFLRRNLTKRARSVICRSLDHFVSKGE